MPRPSRRVLPVATSSAGVQLSTFRQCPLKYRFRYLDRLEPEFVSASLLVGSSIHAAIEHHHRRQLESDEPAMLNELLEVFWDEWRCRMEESPEVRFGKNEDVASIDDLAKRMLSSFIDSDLAKAPGVVIGIEESLRSTVIDARPEFLGIVDLVFESGDALTIRDYKTSRSKWNQGTAESSADQLFLYAEIAKALVPGKKVEVEFVVLTKTKSPTIELFKVNARSSTLGTHKTGRQLHPGRDRSWHLLSESIRHELRRLPVSVGLCGLAWLISLPRREAHVERTKKTKHDFPGPGGFLGRLGWAGF